MGRDENAVFEDSDRVGEDMNIERASARGVRDAAKIATDADHAIVGGAPFEPQDRFVSRQRQLLQDGLLVGEGLLTTRCVVAWTRGFATMLSQCRNWPFRSSRFRKEPPRK